MQSPIEMPFFSTAIQLARPLCLALLTLLFVPALQAGEVESSSLGSIVVPAPVKPVAASQCVEPVDIMRRNHMEFLLHQRDETMVNGDRSNKYSLAKCVECHAQTDNNGEVVRSNNEDYFCNSCHQFASVKIDCFECHADRPLTAITSSSLSSAAFDQQSEPATLNAYINRELLLQVNLRND